MRGCRKLSRALDAREQRLDLHGLCAGLELSPNQLFGQGSVQFWSPETRKDARPRLGQERREQGRDYAQRLEQLPK